MGNYNKVRIWKEKANHLFHIFPTKTLFPQTFPLLTSKTTDKNISNFVGRFNTSIICSIECHIEFEIVAYDTNS